MNPIRRIQEFGQSVWYDNIHRSMIHSGELDTMIEEDGLRGITSNPTIFEKAIGSGDAYDDGIRKRLRENPELSARELFFQLAIEDIQAAADRFQRVYEHTRAADGYVSLEVSPDLAYDTDATITEARQLWQRVDRPNLMIKVPATKEGLPAITTLISDGINVNVTLLFAVPRYEAVVEAYLAGLTKRQKQGHPLDRIASVASFFVSRVDTALDQRLEQIRDPEQAATAQSLRGTLAIANAKVAYKSYLRLYNDPRFAELRAAGARPQRLLWASTGTKNPAYSDVLYLENLIGENTVNTVPPATYQAFKDHGTVRASLHENLDQAEEQLKTLPRLGIDLTEVTDQLEREGVAAFQQSFEHLVAVIEEKMQQLRSTPVA